MRPDWPIYFRRERAIRTLARDAGLGPRRAETLAARLASRPLPPQTSARLLRALGQRQAAQPDTTIAAAHRLLSRLEPAETPWLGHVRLQPLGTDWARGFRNGPILIDPTSPAYRAATAGDLLPLAMLLHHEQQHVRGADEVAALTASRAFLKTHGGSPALIVEIEERLGTERLKGDHMVAHASTCSGCPHCQADLASTLSMSPQNYARWLTETQRRQAQRAGVGLRSATLRTNVHLEEEPIMSTIRDVSTPPDPYREPLRRLRAAQGLPEPSTDDAALASMVRFRAQFYETTAVSRAAAATTPASGDVYANPPDPYSEAALRAWRERR
jgi:hypothetical protein